MRLTAILLRKAKAGPARNIKSLALSVYFKHPDFDMKKPEILSRASAFLLSVDPPEKDPESDKDSPYGHLEKNEKERKYKMGKHMGKFTPVSETNRELKDIGWLEYAPREVRPTVHCVCSSHVLAPFLWKDYYPHDWLKNITQEHCSYALEVFDSENPQQALGKFALHPYPIHHPDGRDIALVHLKQEEENLGLMKKLGVKVHHMRDFENLFKKGESLTFDGYEVVQPNQADNDQISTDGSNKPEQTEDLRIFLPYREMGELSFHTNDRFFASTPKPLPEGLCGGPVLDSDDKICGVIEGIVSKTNPDKRIVGSAAFMPNFIMAPFIEYAERMMLKNILPKDLFDWSVSAKMTNSFQGQNDDLGSSLQMEEEFEREIDRMKETHTREEIDALLKTIKRERDEVLEIMTKEGGDMDEVAAQVHQRTMNVRAAIHEEFRKGIINKSEGSARSDKDSDNTTEAEIVNSK